MTENLPPQTEIVDYDFLTAVADPSRFFENPAAILADDAMTIEQKRRFLEAWEQDLKDRQRAAQEGMVPDGPAAGDNDAAMLKHVISALDRLGDMPATKDGKGRQFWQRWINALNG